MVFWHPRAGRSGRKSSSTCAASIAATATRKCAAPDPRPRPVGENPGHWENYKDNMFTTESENRDYAVKPMNCPGHIQIFNRACAATATCRCATANSAPAIATSRQGRCTASCACAASSRTTATSSAPKTRSSRSRDRLQRSGAKVYADFGFTTSSSSWRLASGKAHRFRRSLGQGRSCPCAKA
jgi:hypothetical protein